MEAAEKVAAAIWAEGGQAATIQCDIADRASVNAPVAATEAQLGPIDVLVNNAGWDVFKPFTKTEPAQWDKLIARNLTGALHMHHAVLPGIAARNAGRIVNIASDAGPGPAPPARRSTPPAKADGSHSRRPWRASMRAMASQSTWSAPARPTRHCLPGLLKVRRAPRN